MECYCKSRFLHCPIVSFELQADEISDPRVWLETDGQVGPKSTTLVINTSKNFLQTYRLTSHYINVRDSPSINIRIKVGDGEVFNLTEAFYSET